MENDLLLTVAYGHQNLYMDKLLKKGGKNYVTKNNRKIDKEYELFEDNLEKELELERERFECDQKDFEKNLNFKDRLDFSEFYEETNQHDKLMELFSGYDYVDHTFIYNPIGSKTKKRFTIIRQCDIIKDFVLQIELGESFDGLSIEEKYGILESEFELEIGGCRIDKTSILNALFIQICKGKSILERDNIIQIPIYDFNNMMYKHDNKLSKFKGLPIISISYNEIRINLEVPPILSRFKFDLIVNGMLNQNEDRKTLAQGKWEFLVYLNELFTEEYEENKFQKIRLPFNNPSKFVLLYFKPKIYSNTNFFDFTTNYPLIENAELICNGIKCLNFSEADDEILSFDFFGIKIYLLPYSSDVDSWEKIQKMFQDHYENLNSSCINSSRIDNMMLKLDINGNSEGYSLKLNNVHFNVMRIISGMCGKAYAN
jgi:hypothetical protein